MTGRSAEGEIGCEFFDLVDGHIVGHVELVCEAGGKLDGGMHRKRAADVASDVRSLEQCW